MSAGRAGPFLQTCAVLTRQRWLTVPGEVLVAIGDRAMAETVVARAPGQGRLQTINAVRMLDILPAELPTAMCVAVGDEVAAGQPLARTRGLFGLFAATCVAPVSGTVVAVSAHTGRILLEEPATDQEVRAFLPGVVTDVEPRRGATVAGWATRVAGLYGVGGERSGLLCAVVDDPETRLEAGMFGAEVAGKIMLGGALVSAAALREATAFGAAGLVTGGVHDLDIASWLGAEPVLADTTGIEVPLTLVVVGGFGRVPMDHRTFAELRRHVGRRVCVSGHTRVRAGTLRPEVIVPLAIEAELRPQEVIPPPLRVGSLVQIVRSPWFGQHGRIGRLPREPRVVESEAVCLVAEVDLEGGDTVTIPLANLEILGGPDAEVGT